MFKCIYLIGFLLFLPNGPFSSKWSDDFCEIYFQSTVMGFSSMSERLDIDLLLPANVLFDERSAIRLPSPYKWTIDSE